MEDEPARRRQRRRSNARRRCPREGCSKRVGSGYTHCSHLCRCVDQALTESQNVCSAVGPSDTTCQLWASAALLNDALTDYLRLSGRVDRDALDSGISPEQWRAVRAGEAGSADVCGPGTCLATG